MSLGVVTGYTLTATPRSWKARGELGIVDEGGIGLTDHRHGVAGDGGEIGKQRTEAVDGQAVLGALCGGLARAGLGALGLGDDGDAGGLGAWPIVSGEQDVG